MPSWLVDLLALISFQSATSASCEPSVFHHTQLQTKTLFFFKIGIYYVALVNLGLRDLPVSASKAQAWMLCSEQ